MTDYFRQIELPSRGLFYGDGVPGGIVHVEPMGTKQEKLFAAGRQGSVVLDKIFDDCLSVPIPHKKLILGDRIWALLNIRSVSRSNMYPVGYKCEDCRKQGSVEIDLLKLPIRTLPEDFTIEDYPFTCKLPLQEKEIGIRLLTGEDEDSIERYGKQVGKHNPQAEEPAKYVYRLARKIATIDGEKAGIQDSMRLVESLVGADSQAVQDSLDEYAVGPDLNIEITCQHCGYENDEEVIPIKGAFFRPKRRRAADGDYIRTAVVLDEQS